MKLNKWTVALAAVGLVSVASVKAEEAATPLLTALSSTTLSGYVDVGAHWNPGNNIAPIPLSGGKNDGFNLNSVLVSLEKPLEEGDWSAGYRVDLQFGPDAVNIGGDADPGSDNIRQAYVALRAPLGNGLDLKLGRWDTIIGYESADSYKNPNYTRSYGWGIEPTEHTGLLMTYQALDILAVNVGVANTANTLGINTKAHNVSNRAESHKTYMASVALTAPDDMGVLAGSALYLGIIDGFGTASDDQTSFYAGATFATPIEGLRFGAAFDYVEDLASGVAFPIPGGITELDAWTAALYASFKATDALGFHLRGEYVDIEGENLGGDFDTDGFAVTGTIQYDLWENVLTRLEARWDHSDDELFGEDAFLIAVNLVYRF